jgi:hypothetical protein
MASHPSVLLEEASLFFGLACFDRGGELLGFGMAREALASRCYNKLSEMMPLVLAHGLTFPLAISRGALGLPRGREFIQELKVPRH